MAEYAILPAIDEDIPEVVSLGRQMHAEMEQYRHRRWDDGIMGDTVRMLIASDDGAALLAVEAESGEIAGAILLGVGQDFFGPERTATEIGLFVSRPHRGAGAVQLLLAAAERWSADRGATDWYLSISRGAHWRAVGRFYGSLGYGQDGAVFHKRLLQSAP